MVSNLNRLADLVELDSLPLWLRQEIELKKDEILQKLHTDGFFIFVGPNGEKIQVRSKQKAA